MELRRLVQVTELVDNQLLYGFKPIGSVDPLWEDLEWQATTTPVPAGTEPYMMNMSSYGQKDSNPGRWNVCPICQEEFHEGEMITVQGRLYCTQNGCYKDVI